MGACSCTEREDYSTEVNSSEVVREHKLKILARSTEIKESDLRYAQCPS